jgi:hypothetical protein
MTWYLWLLLGFAGGISFTGLLATWIVSKAEQEAEDE